MSRRNWGVMIIIGVCAPSYVFAQVIITEVMYDLAEGSDSGREWMEVYNVGASPVVLTGWKVFENGKNHKITTVSLGETFAPASFAVIADNAEKFKVDHPEFIGQLFDSVFSLNNSGEIVALHDVGGTEIDSVMYTSALGGSGTGDSLQKTELVSGASLSAGIPTPGAPIPAGGLVQTPPKEKKSTSSKKALPASARPVVRETYDPNASEERESQVASVISSTSGSQASYLWWIGTLMIASAGAAGAAFSRRAKRTEWDIIEETG